MNLNQLIPLEAALQPATTVVGCSNFPWCMPDCFLQVFQMCQCLGQTRKLCTVWFDSGKENKVCVLSKQKAPAKSRKLCGQWCWHFGYISLF